MSSSTDTTGTTDSSVKPARGRKPRAAAAGDTSSAAEGKARRTATAFMAYRADFSEVLIFTREGEALQHAFRNAMRVAPVASGENIRDAAERQQALENGGGSE